MATQIMQIVRIELPKKEFIKRSAEQNLNAAIRRGEYGEEDVNDDLRRRFEQKVKDKLRTNDPNQVIENSVPEYPDTEHYVLKR